MGEFRAIPIPVEDLVIGPDVLIPVRWVPRVCVELDLLGNAVLDALTWDWPKWKPWCPKIDLSEKIHLLQPAAAYPVFFSGDHDWPKP